MLAVAERGALTRSAANDKRVDTKVYLSVDKIAQGYVINLSVREGSNKCGGCSLEYCFFVFAHNPFLSLSTPVFFNKVLQKKT
jgi:hypothetical protein